MDQKSLETFGKYLLLSKLGSGGMAEVFLARPAISFGNGSLLAIKRVLPHVAGDPAFVRMFKSEIQVCLGLNHPHIVHINDFGEMNEQPYIAMEFIEGVNLKQLVAKFSEKGENLPIELAVSIATQAASGLHYAHSFVNSATGECLKLVHRDISPQNLILSYEGNLKIIDFGIAKATSGLSEATQTGTLKGKVSYMSPEQVNMNKIDARSDIFSLGIVLWEMLTGRRLFSKSGDSEYRILEKILDCENSIVYPSLLNPKIPPSLDEIVMKALTKDPAQRYQTAAELQNDLRKYLFTSAPGYSYSDVGRAVNSAFGAEILAERKKLRELNEAAQALLEQTVSLNIHYKPNAVAYPPPFVPPVAPPLVLAKLGNQRVRASHLVMLAIYILSIVGIKLDEKYFFVERLIMPTEAVIRASNSSSSSLAERPLALKNTEHPNHGKQRH